MSTLPSLGQMSSLLDKVQMSSLLDERTNVVFAK